MRPRVVLLSSYPPDHRSFTGGVQTATAALIEGLSGRDLDLHVVSSAASGADARQERGGVTFHFLAAPRRLRPRFPFRALKARRALRRLRPDVVHCQDTLVLGLAAVAGPWAKVFTVHGIKQAEARLRTGWEGRAAAFEARLQDRVQRRFDVVVCNSDYAARQVGTATRTVRIPNAVRGDLFDVARDPRPELVFVGALTPLKRPGDLVAAHAALGRDELRTRICGPVEDRDYVDGLRRNAPPGVSWEGTVDPARLRALLETATAVVLPSAQENVPMVVAEAMAAGVPAVATRLGGIPEMVEDGTTGLLYDAGDVAGLTDCLRRLLDDPGLVRRMGAAARERARALYAPEVVAERTLALYRELVAG